MRMARKSRSAAVTSGPLQTFTDMAPPRALRPVADPVADPVVRDETPTMVPQKLPRARSGLSALEVRLCAVRVGVGFAIGAIGLLVGDHRVLLLALGAVLVVFSAAALYEHISGETDTDPRLVASVLFTTDALVGGLCLALIHLPVAVRLAAALTLVTVATQRRRGFGALTAAGLLTAANTVGVISLLKYGDRMSELPAAAGDSFFASAFVIGAAALVQWQADVIKRLRFERNQLKVGVAATTQNETDRDLRVERLLESVSDGVLTLDQDSRVVGANERASRLLATDTDALVGRELIEMVEEADKDALAYFLWVNISSKLDDTYFSRSHETRLRRAGGDFLTVELRVGEIARGDERLFVCDMRDISDHKARMEVLEYRAMHDPLTGLPNRALFTDRLRNAISISARQRGVVGLLLLDLDGFKEINDSLGHQCGDQLLRQVTDRLLGCVRDSDTVARLGGDEFAVIAPDVAETGSTARLAERLQEAFLTPFVLEGKVVRVSASIGVALCPEHSTDDASLLRQADVAMYVAKAAHSGTFVYSPERDEHSAQRMIRLAELNNAIIRNELVLHYQPKVAIATGEVVGVEALVRWQHPMSGLIFPDDFIPVVEGTELMWPMTESIMRMAFTQARKWHLAGLDIGVSVNLSAGNLSNPDVGTDIGRLLAEIGLQPEALTVEITESSLMATGAARALEGIRGTGVGLSADDFGTGFSSLSALKAMPLTELKIDKSFVLRMDQELNDAAIVGPIVELGRKRGLKVVAEGVENPQIFRMLADFNCELAQGYYIAKPMPGYDFEPWLSSSPWRPCLRTSSSVVVPQPGISPLAVSIVPVVPVVPVVQVAEGDLTPHERALTHLYQPEPEPSQTTRDRPVRRPAQPTRVTAVGAGRARKGTRAASVAATSADTSSASERALLRRERDLNVGLEAVIAFVDGPPRRAHANKCVAVLKKAVPNRERGPQLAMFFSAAESGEGPVRLQARAEDAGIEMAAALKEVRRTLASSDRQAQLVEKDHAG
ncbi:MAG: putative bifunctional diguanylate cyclase/phosphodiesterase [Candidatus Dormibacteria bacterium]